MARIVKDKQEYIYIYDAKDILQVSKQRINQIAKDDVIPVYEIAGLQFFKKSDVENYKNTRKVGRPAKSYV